MKEILRLKDISKRFAKKIDVAAKFLNFFGANFDNQVVHAVDGVNLNFDQGQVVGLIGESGCGKSTLGRVVAGISEPSEGEIFYRGKEVKELIAENRQRQNAKIQMVFQDPMSSLNPRKRVMDTIGEAPVYHGQISKKDRQDYVETLLNQVGLDKEYAKRLPHQFSGGQRQRIGIARALAVRPEFLVCDEAVAALDVSIQAQILNLFMDLREKLDLTYLFISHDLGVVHHIADKIVIMYLGRVVESASKEELFSRPNHPYTDALLKDVPRIDRRNQKYFPIKGELPSPLDPPNGCHFHPRCPHAKSRCRIEAPSLKEIAPGRLSACHLNED